jgi:hypothetical protein
MLQGPDTAPLAVTRAPTLEEKERKINTRLRVFLGYRYTSLENKGHWQMDILAKTAISLDDNSTEVGGAFANGENHAWKFKV